MMETIYALTKFRDGDKSMKEIKRPYLFYFIVILISGIVNFGLIYLWAKLLEHFFLVI